MRDTVTGLSASRRNGTTPPSGSNGSGPPRVLFVCIENSNRSQMAEGFARLHGEGVIVAASAGSRPASRVNPRAVAAMAERGYDITGHRLQSLVVAGPGPWDYVVTMGCGDACPWVPAVERIDWEIPDPARLSDDEFRAVRDRIEHAVLNLIAKIKAVSRKP